LVRAPTIIVALIDVSADTATKSPERGASRGAEGPLHHLGARGLAVREALQSEPVKQREVREQIDGGNDQQADHECRHDRAAAALDLGRHIRCLVPAAVGQEDEHHRKPEHAERGRRAEGGRRRGGDGRRQKAGDRHDQQPPTSTSSRRFCVPADARKPAMLSTVSAMTIPRGPDRARRRPSGSTVDM
jgi:hypothetical protein